MIVVLKFPMTKEGSDALTKHQDDAMNGYLAAGMDPFTTCGGSTSYDSYEIKKVKVGSHEEDHGHYEIETYVDSYYCDCGATK